MQKISMNEIELYSLLIGFKKLNGNDALAALLRKLGVKSPGDIDASRFPEIELLCNGTRGLGIVAGEDAATGATDALEKVVADKRAARKEARTLSAFKTVVASGKDLQDGLDMAARAVHARRSK